MALPEGGIVTSLDRLPHEPIDAYVRRAVLDPGSFTKRGRGPDGEEYGETLARWQGRAVDMAVREVLIDFGTWISQQEEIDAATVDEVVDGFLQADP